jgi:rare lipoprotein A
MMVRASTMAAVCLISLLAGPAHAANTLTKQTGLASIYSYKGQRTASGERVQPTHLTAAHRTLPFGTMVRVTNHRNGRSVVVRINDRGPFVVGRVLDVTPNVARQLNFSGVTPVSLEPGGSQ